jgi:hypothetical protein
MAAGSVATAALQKGTAYSGGSYSSVFDSSNWNVNVGSGTQSASQSSRAGGAAPGALNTAPGMPKNPIVLIGLVLLAAYLLAE